MNIAEKYSAYVAQMQKIQDLNSSIALLHWDHEVNAPAKGAARRAGQIATLVSTVHEWTTADELTALVTDLYEHRAELASDEASNICLSWEQIQRAQKLSTAFVTQFSKVKSAASNAWVAARKANDFEVFKPALKELVTMLRQKAALIGYEGHPYDALLEEYERGMTVDKLDMLFKDIRQELVAFAQELKEKGIPTSTDFLTQKYNEDKQWDFGLYLLEQMGYDFEAGRQDRSIHPFTTSFSVTDVRVTTRIIEDKPIEMITSCIHEGGHGLYEQGLQDSYYGLPMGSATSLGIHESQSRIWENNVGLSKSYWTVNYPHLKQLFTEQLDAIDLEHFYKAINQVSPNLIRIQADEIHYHLHVLIRYQIEKGLLDGTIEVDELEAVWNNLYEEYMGVVVPDAINGILQDVHWSEALVGYFPTYSLGSLYAAQFYEQAKRDIPDLEKQISKGDLLPLKKWLNEVIHQYGQKYTSEELCQRITGEGLNFKYFMQSIRDKYVSIYNLPT
jgi:carboxypeptidase Taq